MRLLPLLLLAACSGPAASEYQRGTPVSRPPPAPVRPGVGAPVVGQPSATPAPLPRSPHKRVLPPTSEPGLWSADTPRASAEEGMPSVLGFEPPGTEGHEDDTDGIARTCALMVHDTARFRSVEQALDRHSDATVACTGARVMTACMARFYFGWEGRNLPENRALAADFEKYSLRLNGATEKACRGIDFKHPDIVALFNTVRTAWLNSMQTWLDRH